MSIDSMTEDEIREAIKRAGIKDGWNEMGGKGPQKPAFMRRQAKNLQNLRGMLEQALGDKQGEVRSLREKLARLKHGGGS